MNPYFSMISKEFIILSYSLYALGHSFFGRGGGKGCLFVCFLREAVFHIQAAHKEECTQSTTNSLFILH